MLTARTATYNGSPRAQQVWTKTFAHDGDTVTIVYRQQPNGYRSTTVQEPSTAWYRRERSDPQQVLL